MLEGHGSHAVGFSAGIGSVASTAVEVNSFFLQCELLYSSIKYMKPSPTCLTVRVGPLNREIAERARLASRSQSEVVRAALTIFLAEHKTAESINDAIVKASSLVSSS